MLAALLLLGILPFAALPLMQDDLDDTEGESLDDTSGSVGTGETDGLASMLDGEESQTTDPEGEVLTIPADPGETVISEFAAGVDIVELDLTSVSEDIFMDTGTTPDGATVSFTIGSEAVTTLIFDGMTEVPSSDILLKINDEDTEETFEILLTDALAAQDSAAGLFAPTEVDEDIDDLSAAHEDSKEATFTGPIVVPQESIDEAETDDSDAGAEAAPPEASQDAPDDGDDDADSHAAQDLFWLHQDSADAIAVADVEEFEVGQDFLRVSLNPKTGDTDEPQVLVAPSDDGQDGMVSVNGDLIAILRGAPTATASDVFAEIAPDVFN